jgi:toxin CptA
MSSSLTARLALAAALLGGAVWGGWTAGRFRATRITAGALLRCVCGGALMGAGTLLIPGSNDGLILVGMPLLWPYAWVGFAAMCISIGLAQLAFSHFNHGPAGTQTTS